VNYLLASAHACTPSACAWSQVAAQYKSEGFLVGLITIGIVFFLARAAWRSRSRR
jgi:hypothetical protein